MENEKKGLIRVHVGPGQENLCRCSKIKLFYLTVECQSFCPKIVTVFMSAFKSTEQVLEGESDNGNPDVRQEKL
jgi:hypothetical protein